MSKGGDSYKVIQGVTYYNTLHNDCRVGDRRIA